MKIMDGFQKLKQHSHILHNKIKKKKKKINLASSKVLLSINQVSSDTSISPDEVSMCKTIIHNPNKKSRNSAPKKMKKERKILEQIDPKMRDAHFLHENHLCSVCDINDEKYCKTAKGSKNFEKSYPSAEVLTTTNFPVLKTTEKPKLVKDKNQVAAKDLDQHYLPQSSTSKEQKEKRSKQKKEQIIFFKKCVSNEPSKEFVNNKNMKKENFFEKVNNSQSFNTSKTSAGIGPNLHVKNKKEKDKSLEISSMDDKNWDSVGDSNQNSSIYASTPKKHKKKKSNDKTKQQNSLEKGNDNTINVSVESSDLSNKKKKRKNVFTEKHRMENTKNHPEATLGLANNAISGRNSFSEKNFANGLHNESSEHTPNLQIKSKNEKEKPLESSKVVKDQNQDSVRNFYQNSLVFASTPKKHKKKKSNEKTEEQNFFVKGKDSTFNVFVESSDLSNNKKKKRKNGFTEEHRMKNTKNDPEPNNAISGRESFSEKNMPNSNFLNSSDLEHKESNKNTPNSHIKNKREKEKSLQISLEVEEKNQDYGMDSNKNSSLYVSNHKKHKKKKEKEKTEPQNSIKKDDNHVFVNKSDTSSNKKKKRKNLLPQEHRVENTGNDSEAILTIASNSISEREGFAKKEVPSSTFLNSLDPEHIENNTNTPNLYFKNEKKKEKTSKILVAVEDENRDSLNDSDKKLSICASTHKKHKKKKSKEKTEPQNSIKKDENHVFIDASDMSKNKKKKNKTYLIEEHRMENSGNVSEALSTLAKNLNTERESFADNMSNSTLLNSSDLQHNKSNKYKKNKSTNEHSREYIVNYNIKDKEDLLVESLGKTIKKKTNIYLNENALETKINQDLTEEIVDIASHPLNHFNSQSKESCLNNAAIKRKKKRKHLKDMGEDTKNESFIDNNLNLDTDIVSNMNKKKQKRLEHFVKEHDKKHVTVDTPDLKKKEEDNILKMLDLSHSFGSENENFIFGSNNKVNKIQDKKSEKGNYVKKSYKSIQDKTEDNQPREGKRKSTERLGMETINADKRKSKKRTESDELNGMMTVVANNNENKKDFKECNNLLNTTLDCLNDNHFTIHNITEDNQPKQNLFKRHKEIEDKWESPDGLVNNNSFVNNDETNEGTKTGERSGMPSNVISTHENKKELKEYKNLLNTTSLDGLNDNQNYSEDDQPNGESTECYETKTIPETKERSGMTSKILNNEKKKKNKLKRHKNLLNTTVLEGLNDNNLQSDLDSIPENEILSANDKTTDVTENPSPKRLSYAEVNLDVLSSMQEKVLSGLHYKKRKKEAIANYISDDSEIIIPEKKRKFKNVNKLIKPKQVKLNDNNDSNFLQHLQKENHGIGGQSTLDNFLVPKGEDYHILGNNMKETNAKKEQQSTIDKYLVAKSRDVQNDKDMRLSTKDVKTINPPEKKIQIIRDEIIVSSKQSNTWFKSSSPSSVQEKSQILNETDPPTDEERASDSKEDLQSPKIEIKEHHLDYSSDMEFSNKGGLIPKDLFSKYTDSDDGFIEDSKEDLDLLNKSNSMGENHQENKNDKKLSVSQVYGSDDSDMDLSDSEKLPVKQVKQEKSNKKSIQRSKKLLSNKPCDVDFDVPPLHKLFPQNTFLTPDVKKEILKLNIPMKNGKYSAAEDKQLKANWYAFAEKFEINDSPKEFFYLKPTVISKDEKKVFLYHLGRNLNDRNLGSVFKRFKRLFNEEKGGRYERFSKEEDNVILRIMKESGKESGYVVKIANELKRTKISVERRIKVLKQGKPRKIKWKKHNVTAFIKALLKVTRSENVNDLKNRTISREEWEKLSRALDDMPLPALRKAWYFHIHPRLFLNSDYIDLTEVKKKLILLFYENKEKDWKLLNWKKYLPYFDGFTTLKLFHIFHDLVKIRVPVEDRKDLEKSVEILKECLDKGDFGWSKYLTKINFIDGKATEVKIVPEKSKCRPGKNDT